MTRKLRRAGAVTVTAGSMLLVYAIVKAQDWGWASAKTLALAAGARRCWRPSSSSNFAFAAAAGATVVLQPRWDRRQLRDVRSSPRGMFGMFYFASLYVQQILGYAPLQAGSPSCRSRGIMIGAGPRSS